MRTRRETLGKRSRALKLFPSTSGQSAYSSIQLRAEADSQLNYLPGELIPYRQAIYAQRAVIDVHPTAHVAYAEIITPGRTAMGERFAFERLDLRLDVSVGDRRILKERSLIETSKRPLDRLGRNGSFNVTGTLYLIGEQCRAFGSGSSESGARWASDGDGRYVLVRYAARTAQEIQALIRQHIVTAKNAFP